jgi:hypothetical protein
LLAWLLQLMELGHLQLPLPQPLPLLQVVAGTAVVAPDPHDPATESHKQPLLAWLLQLMELGHTQLPLPQPLVLDSVVGTAVVPRSSHVCVQYDQVHAASLPQFFSVFCEAHVLAAAATMPSLHSAAAMISTQRVGLNMLYGSWFV